MKKITIILVSSLLLVSTLNAKENESREIPKVREVEHRTVEIPKVREVEHRTVEVRKARKIRDNRVVSSRKPRESREANIR